MPTSELRSTSWVAVCSFSRCEFLLDQIDDDDHVGAKVACDVHRDVAHHAAVGKDVLLSHHRREGARDGHAGAHGGREVAVLEHHHLAGDHVGRDGAEGDRQPVEIRLRARRRDVGSQQVLDVAGVDDARRQHDPLVPQAHFDVVAVGHSGALLLDRLQVALANAADHGLPVDAGHELLESGRRECRTRSRRRPGRPCWCRRCSRSGRAFPPALSARRRGRRPWHRRPPAPGRRGAEALRWRTLRRRRDPRHAQNRRAGSRQAAETTCGRRMTRDIDGAPGRNCARSDQTRSIPPHAKYAETVAQPSRAAPRIHAQRSGRSRRNIQCNCGLLSVVGRTRMGSILNENPAWGL